MGRYSVPVFLLLAIILSSFSCFAIEIDIPDKALPPNVKTLSRYEILDDQTGRKQHQLIERTIYDRLGRPQREIVRRDASAFWTVHYVYKNNLLAEKYALDRQDTTVWSIDYSYDRKGRLLQETHSNRYGQPDYTVIHEYSADRTETMAYGPDGSVQWRRKTVELKKGKVREISYYYPDGTRIKGVVETYNVRGKIIKETHIDEIGTVYRRIITEYDELGRVTGRTVYDDRGSIHRQVWLQYLDNGHIGTVRQVLPQENRVESMEYDYQLDHRGVWTSRQEKITIRRRESSEPLVQIKEELRDIEYFSSDDSEEAGRNTE
jgi:hypothetical protein